LAVAPQGCGGHFFGDAQTLAEQVAREAPFQTDDRSFLKTRLSVKTASFFSVAGTRWRSST
jgi:hypothetical protein